MVVVHLREHVDRVGIERKVGGMNDTEGIELVSKRTFPKHELRRVRTIKTVNAVCPAEAVLHRHGRTQFIIVIPELVST